MSIDKLSSLPVFRSVERADLEDLLLRIPVQHHPPGAVLFQQGEPAEDAVLLVDGLLEVSVRTEHQTQHIGTIHPGEIAGEQGLFVRGGERNAAVMVTRPSMTLRLTPGLLHMARTNMAVVALERHLIASLARRVRSTNLAIQRAWKEEAQARASQTPVSAEKTGAMTFRERLLSLFRG